LHKATEESIASCMRSFATNRVWRNISGHIGITEMLDMLMPNRLANEASMKLASVTLIDIYQPKVVPRMHMPVS
jgi:hypothetical protein